MPRPLSATLTLLPGRRVISMSLAKSPIASSRELSKISVTRWWRPSGPVVPIYIPGRLRTGSKPSRTVMDSALYLLDEAGPDFCSFSAMFVIPYSSINRAGKKAKKEHNHALFWGLDPADLGPEIGFGAALQFGVNFIHFFVGQGPVEVAVSDAE